ncbi:MAG: putative tRNA sulfurtransferase [Firmicutes bacterium ADurb.Bin193]|nr:MAG: putative tRNA sulfurtransferase [Firmicutes bacterium ADurb.Bin193]
MNSLILLKYGEIILKGLNRPLFEDKLIANLKSAGGDDISKIWKAQAAIYVEPREGADEEELALRLSRVFGIVSAAVAYIAEKNLESICALAKELMKDAEGKTFKVESKRADKKFPHTSQELSALVGEAVFENFDHLSVDLKNPDILLTVEIRDFAAYIYLNKIQGVGGMPTGTNGRATLLLSGGIDSPVAGYVIAKRGVLINAVHFYSYPYTSERAKDKVLELARILAGYCGRLEVNIVPFTDIQLEINQKCPPEQMTIIMRRIMMYIANKIAKKHGSSALITGESVGQVASQTIESLFVTDDAAEYPVFRPLIGMDKEEIVTVARRIGTFETSILPYEDCCTVFTPRHPVTKPRLEKILESEKFLDVEALIKQALDNTETIILTRSGN